MLLVTVLTVALALCAGRAIGYAIVSFASAEQVCSCLDCQGVHDAHRAQGRTLTLTLTAFHQSHSELVGSIACGSQGRLCCMAMWRQPTALSRPFASLNNAAGGALQTNAVLADNNTITVANRTLPIRVSNKPVPSGPRRGPRRCAARQAH